MLETLGDGGRIVALWNVSLLNLQLLMTLQAKDKACVIFRRLLSSVVGEKGIRLFVESKS